MWFRRLGVVFAIICLLGLNESILAKNFTIYQENFNSGASLSQLGFTGTGWELDSAGKYLRSAVPEKGPENSAQTYSAPFNANRDKGVTTVEWRVNYLTTRPGRAWSENNQTWVSLTDASGRKLYTLLFKPHCKQDQWQSFDLELSKDNGSQVIMQGWTLTETPTLAWIDFKLVLSPRSAAGGNGGIKVYANLGSGYQEFISARDESYNEFSKLHLKYQTGKGGQNFSVGIDDLRVSAEDLLSPVTSHDYQDEGKWVKTPVTINLTASDDFSGVLNTYYRINAGVTQTGNQIQLNAEGNYAVEYWSGDKAGNRETAKTFSVKIDLTAPIINAAISPLANSAGWHKNDLTVQFNANDSLSGIKEVTEPITISNEGAGQTVSGTAIDQAGNSASTQVTINLDRTAPVATIQTPAAGASLKERRPVISGSYSDSLAGIDQTTCRITLDGNDITQSAALNVTGFSYIPASNLNTGNHIITVTVSDRAGNEAAVVTSSFKVIPTDPNIPADPATVAPPLDPTIVSDLKAATSFLYTGANPIQTGMDPETIVPTRAAVIRGKVLNKENEALPGVKITILNHGEYGRTYSREDGVFDLAVNGGGYLTVKYEKEGYLSAQRQLNAPWQDYVVAEEVILTQADAVATTISLQDNTSVQIARGSLVSDEDGSRQATVIFPVGIQINGVNDANVTVRATEYTVGPNGPKAMPAELPANTAYTYCVELSVDGYDQVEFNKPVYFYVDNFLNFPVGGIVPSGYYDRNKAAWIPMDNGVIIRIAGITNGLADIDLTGSGQIADAQALTALGFTDGERQKLASMYSAGQSLWRVPLKHFSPCDLNWPIWAGFPLPGSPNAKGDQKTNKPSTSCGSIIEIQNQTLRESIGVPGTNFSINYSSDRVPGRTASNTFTATISGNVIVPELRRIRLEIKVAGRLFTGSYTPEPNKKVTFTWDGKDAYGRVVCGSQPVKIRVGYAYDTTYIAPLAEQRSFGRNAAALIAISGTSDRPDLNVWSEETINLVNTNMKEPLGGWSISAHHSYDPTQKVIYYGNGQRRSATDVSMNIQRFAGVQYGRYEDHYSGDGGQAKNAHFGYMMGMDFGSDGSMYIADSFNNCIRKVTPDGIVNTIAGCNPWGGYNGDNRLANSAWLSHPQAIAIDGEDNIYFSDFANHLIRRISKDGMLTSVAGNGISGFSLDGSQASQASIRDVKAIAVSKDGSIYFVEGYSFQTRIRKIGTDGLLYTVAGTGEWRPFSPDGTPALQANIGYCIFDLAIGSDGSIYFIDAVYHRIRKIDLNGIIHTVAGTGEPSFWGDNVPALWAHLNGTNGHSLTVAQDGSIFFGDWDNAVIRYISPDGIINSLTTASGYPREYYGDNGPAKQAKVYSPSYSIKIGPDKRLYFIDYTCIRSIGSILSNFINEEIFIPSEDGSELYHFDKNGRHLETINALTGTIIYSFNYDPQGRLIQVIDGSNNITTIERDGQGNATAIIGPFGMRNSLALNSDGYLESMTNAANEITSFTYYDGGLLKTLTDPRQQTHQFFYDDLGRLTRDQDPAGGYTVLERTETQTGHQVKSIKGKDATNTYGTNYSVDYLTNGDTRMTSSGCCGGGSSVTTYGTDGSQTTTSPDGTVTTVAYGPDPWFGMQVPFVKSLSVKLPSGKTYSQTGNRSGVYTQPGTWLGLKTLTDTTTINGKTFTSVYNAAAKTVTSTSPLGRQTVTTLDTQGRVIKVEVPGLAPVGFEYDSRGRLWRTTEGSGSTARISSVTYKSNGFIDYVTDPLSRQTSFEYDAIGRVTKQTLPGGRQITFSYDPNGNVTKLTPPGKLEHDFGYNVVDLTENYNPPDVGLSNDQTAYDYNLAKQPTLVTRPDGKTIGFEYDTLGRLLFLTVPEGTVTYHYHPITGKLDNITGTDGAIMSFGYDGSLPTSARWDGEIDGSVGVTYNNDFQVVTQTVNGATPISFTYDNDGLLKTAGALTMNYDSQNGMFKDSVIGNVTDSVTYSIFGEVNHYLASYGGSSIFDVQYGERDKLGRIVTKTETVNGESHLYTYSYDVNTDRLTDVYKDGVLFSHYDYDANGNRTGYVGSSGNVSGTYDNQDRMLSYGNNSYQYSANGELQSKITPDGTTGYNYDVLGNLRSVVLPGGKWIEYVIDGASRRVGKKINGSLVQGLLYQDGLAPVAELDGSGSIVARFVYATGVNVPDYMVKGGVTYRIVTDHLGSPRVIINVATGEIVQRLDYDEFGRVTLDSNPGFQPFGFAGGLYDRDTGLVRFGARDYDAEAGRWTCKDPKRFKGGDTDLYGYCGNDPINTIDPYGKKVYIYSMPVLLGHRHLFIVVKNNKIFTSRSLYPQNIGVGGTSFFVKGKSTPKLGIDLASELGEVKKLPCKSNVKYEATIKPPAGMSEEDFDNLVLNKASTYPFKKRPYDADAGPNSNTYVDDVIESAGGVMPDIPHATAQNWGE